MIYITGDTHQDFSRFTTKNFPVQKEMTKDDRVIICGDFGGIWSGNETETHLLNELDARNFTTCFVDGNHENFDLLNEYEVVDYCGGKAHKIRDSIYHLMRGEVFTFEDKKFFAFGGASSHDIDDGIVTIQQYPDVVERARICNKRRRRGESVRAEGISWWEDEMPTMPERLHGLLSLEKHDWNVDFVVTHCLPSSIAIQLSWFLSEVDPINSYFEELLHRDFKFGAWYAGHYHLNKVVMGKFHELYENIERIV